MLAASLERLGGWGGLLFGSSLDRIKYLGRTGKPEEAPTEVGAARCRLLSALVNKIPNCRRSDPISLGPNLCLLGM